MKLFKKGLPFLAVMTINMAIMTMGLATGLALVVMIVVIPMITFFWTWKELNPASAIAFITILLLGYLVTLDLLVKIDDSNIKK